MKRKVGRKSHEFVLSDAILDETRRLGGGGGGQPGKGQDQSVPISYGSHCIHVAFLFI